MIGQTSAHLLTAADISMRGMLLSWFFDFLLQFITGIDSVLNRYWKK